MPFLSQAQEQLFVPGLPSPPSETNEISKTVLASPRDKPAALPDSTLLGVQEIGNQNDANGYGAATATATKTATTPMFLDPVPPNFQDFVQPRSESSPVPPNNNPYHKNSDQSRHSPAQVVFMEATDPYRLQVLKINGARLTYSDTASRRVEQPTPQVQTPTFDYRSPPRATIDSARNSPTVTTLATNTTTNHSDLFSTMETELLNKLMVDLLSVFETCFVLVFQDVAKTNQAVKEAAKVSATTKQGAKLAETILNQQQVPANPADLKALMQEILWRHRKEKENEKVKNKNKNTAIQRQRRNKLQQKRTGRRQVDRQAQVGQSGRKSLHLASSHQNSKAHSHGTGLYQSRGRSKSSFLPRCKPVPLL